MPARYLRSLLFTFVFFVSLFQIASAAPPTVDPSYGLPVPTVAHSAPPDASWIWAGTVSDNQTVYLRRSFDLKKPPKSANLYITADNFFTLYVNGRQLDQSVPDPTNDNVWQIVHGIDVTAYLHAGRNIVAVKAMNAGGAAGLLAKLSFGQKPVVMSDAAWKVSATPPSTDAWIDANYDDSGWAAATVEAPASGGVWSGAGGLTGWPGYNGVPYLSRLTLPAARVLQVQPGGGKLDGADRLAGSTDAMLTVWPAASASAASPSLVLDFGEEVAGRIAIQAETSGVVQVGTGESLQEATTSPWGGAHLMTLAAGKDSSTPDSAFRYANLVFPAGAAGPFKLRVHLDFLYYPVTYKGSFDCSDPLLTRIWYTGAYTAHLCMQQDIWDAPKRDRARWSGDLNVSGLVIDDVFADKFLMEQTLERLRSDAQGGHPEDQPPAGDVNGIPGYSAAWFCTMADLYRHVGDIDFIRKEHAAILSLLQYDSAEFDPSSHLFVNPANAWTFVDWSPDLDHQSPASYAATDFFFIRAFHDAAFLLRSIGDTTNADKWDRWADQAAGAARANLIDLATGTYSSRVQENSMAVYSGVAVGSQFDPIYKNVLDPSSPAWDHTGDPPYNPGVVSPYYGNYVLQALSDTGHTAAGEDYLRQFWGGMLDEGATTFWEAYDTNWPKTDFHSNLYADDNHGTYVSLCHGWSSGPTSWLTERVLGVSPTSGGFHTALIAPDLGSLKWAEGVVPTPRGPIHVRVDSLPNGLSARITLPPGVQATVRLPGARLTLDGKPAGASASAPGMIQFVADHAGDYSFVSFTGPK